MIEPRGPLPARRMAAHRVVLAAAALTTLVAATVGAALAAFAGQALPQAVRHDLAAAHGTSPGLSAVASSGDLDSTSATLKAAVGAAAPGVPFGFWQASWSDPLGLAGGTLPGRPASAPAGTTPLLQAAAMQEVKSYAVLASGRWPTAPAVRGPVPAALPASAAALLGVTTGDVLRLRDRITGTPVSFRVTGLFAQRRPVGLAAPYWQLDPVPASGSSTVVRDAVRSGEVTASWQAAGADATVVASVLKVQSAVIEPAALRAAEAAPGVTHAAALWQTTWSTPGDRQLTGLVVDPAS